MGNVGASLIGPLKGNMPYINIPLAPFKGGITGNKGGICPSRLRDSGVLEIYLLSRFANTSLGIA